MRGLGKQTLELIQYARQLLEADHPQTLRQLHYAIFSRNEIDYENTQSAYKRLSRATTAARRAYRQWELHHDGGKPAYGIPPGWMIDETREPESPNVWEDVGAYLEAVKWSYRRDAWQTQPHHIEVWSEKATILGSLRPIAKEWGFTTRVLHGFGSAGMENATGAEFSFIDKPITVFFLGDHDPSGRIIEEDIHRRVQEASIVTFDIKRLAIHAQDIAKFNLPPQRIKTSDTRAAAFRRRYGTSAQTIELDALPASELRHRIEDAVKGLVDLEEWDRQIDIQRVEISSISSIVAEVQKASGGNELH